MSIIFILCEYLQVSSLQPFVCLIDSICACLCDSCAVCCFCTQTLYWRKTTYDSFIRTTLVSSYFIFNQYASYLMFFVYVEMINDIYIYTHKINVFSRNNNYFHVLLHITFFLCKSEEILCIVFLAFAVWTTERHNDWCLMSITINLDINYIQFYSFLESIYLWYSYVRMLWVVTMTVSYREQLLHQDRIEFKSDIALSHHNIARTISRFVFVRFKWNIKTTFSKLFRPINTLLFYFVIMCVKHLYLLNKLRYTIIFRSMLVVLGFCVCGRDERGFC